MATDEATRAEKKLAALLLIEADVTIEPAELRRFIKSHWQTIAPLAHIIHAAPDYTKGGGAGTGTMPHKQSQSSNGY